METLYKDDHSRIRYSSDSERYVIEINGQTLDVDEKFFECLKEEVKTEDSGLIKVINRLLAE